MLDLFLSCLSPSAAYCLNVVNLQRMIWLACVLSTNCSKKWNKGYDSTKKDKGKRSGEHTKGFEKTFIYYYQELKLANFIHWICGKFSRKKYGYNIILHEDRAHVLRWMSKLMIDVLLLIPGGWCIILFLHKTWRKHDWIADLMNK